MGESLGHLVRLDVKSIPITDNTKMHSPGMSNFSTIPKTNSWYEHSLPLAGNIVDKVYINLFLKVLSASVLVNFEK